MASGDQAFAHLKSDSLKQSYTLDELLDIMAFLRSGEGCPWDRAQNHASLRINLLEEAHETIDAIDSGRPERICDELGDVLMQVVFHAQIAREAGDFSFDDVVTGICRKLISRHTHLFGEDKADTPAEVIDNWEKNKRVEKGLASQAQVLADVPVTLPALLRSCKVQQKAAQVGFDWQDEAGPREKIMEELAEIEQVLALPGSDGKADQLEHEVGDLLFAAVNYARHLKVQPELALSRSTAKFISRFAAVESLARDRQLDMQAMTLAELDALWDEVKAAGSE